MLTEEQRRKKSRETLVARPALVVFLVAGLVWAVNVLRPSSPSSEVTVPSLLCSLEGYTETVQPLLGEWDDAVALANQTSRMNLSSVISGLQEIKRRATNLEVDKCFEDAHPFLIKHMEYTIEGFLAFMSQESDSTVQTRFSLAETNFETYLLRLSD